MANGFTKGEWKREGNKIQKIGQGTIAICPSPTNNEGVFEFIANAKLIAVAPAMYEALQNSNKVFKFLKEKLPLSDTSIGGMQINNALFLNEKVLAQAEGKQ